MDWSKNLLLSLRNPTGSATQDTLPNKQEESRVSFELLSATAFDDQLAGEEVTETFAFRMEDCIELLGATVERTHKKSEYPRGRNGQARSSGDSRVRRKSTWEPRMTAICSPRPERSDWVAALGSFGDAQQTTRPAGLDLILRSHPREKRMG